MSFTLSRRKERQSFAVSALVLPYVNESPSPSGLALRFFFILICQCQPNPQRFPPVCSWNKSPVCFGVHDRAKLCDVEPPHPPDPPCVRVTHLMLTLKVWPSHAWVHMCEARRLRCGTHTHTRRAQYSRAIVLPHPVYSRSTSSNYRVFVRKSRTRQAGSESAAIKPKSGTGGGPSPKHLSNALTSRAHSLICIASVLRPQKLECEAPWTPVKKKKKLSPKLRLGAGVGSSARDAAARSIQ